MPSKGSTKPDDEMRARYRKCRVNGRQMPLHRHLMELHLGRSLLPDELVHHINGNRLDNRIENLAVVSPKIHSAKHPISDAHRARLKQSRPRWTLEQRLARSAMIRRLHIDHPDLKQRISASMREARKRKFWSSKK